MLISTDSEEIAEISRYFGAQTPILRPSYLATDEATDREVFVHFFKEAEKLDIPISRNVVHLRPTTPGRNFEIIDKAILEFSLNKNCTSLRSAHSAELYPHKWFNLENKYFVPLIKNLPDVEVTNMPRQMFPKVYIPNGYIDIVSYWTFQVNGKFHGNKIKSYLTNKVIDIDTKLDLEEVKKNKEIKYLSENIKKDYKF